MRLLPMMIIFIPHLSDCQPRKEEETHPCSFLQFSIASENDPKFFALINFNAQRALTTVIVGDCCQSERFNCVDCRLE
jgi:hypothetical protein